MRDHDVGTPLSSSVAPDSSAASSRPPTDRLTSRGERGKQRAKLARVRRQHERTRRRECPKVGRGTLESHERVGVEHHRRAATASAVKRPTPRGATQPRTDHEGVGASDELEELSDGSSSKECANV